MAKGFLDGYKTYDTGNGYGSAKQWRDALRQRMSKEDAEIILKTGEQTPHDILGLSSTASPAEIKKAFRKLISIWHPDVNQHRIADAEEMSKRIIAAYTILSI
jgi:DnaJ-class molecular chaperone